MKKTIGIILILIVVLIGIGAATNYDRLILGIGNYGTDPNPTADLTFQNDEYITNVTNGVLDFGEAFIKTGSLSSGSNGFDSLGLTDTITITGLAITDIAFLTIKSPAPDSADVLSAEVLTNKLVVHRVGGVTDDLTYYWQIIKK